MFSNVWRKLTVHDVIQQRNHNKKFAFGFYYFFHFSQHFNQSSIQFLFFCGSFSEWLFIKLHDVFHNDFFFVKDVFTLDSAWHFASIQIKVIMEVDLVCKSLTLVLLELRGSALPPKMAVGFVRKRNLSHWICEGVFMAERVSRKPQIFVIFERISHYSLCLIFWLSLNQNSEDDHTNHS